MNVTSWEKWQTFRKDRGTPPWIKVYRNLLSNEQWVSLTDEEKGQLVSIWILAADKNGKIPDSTAMIQRMAMLSSVPNINKFIELGFLTTTWQPDDNQLTTKRRQLDAPEQSREEQSREEDIAANAPESKPAASPCPHAEIIDLYQSRLPELQKVVKDRWSGSQRSKDLQARWRESEKHQSLEFWDNYFAAVRSFPFYLGQNDRSWKADLGWLVKRSNFDKMIERIISEGVWK